MFTFVLKKYFSLKKCLHIKKLNFAEHSFKNKTTMKNLILLTLSLCLLTISCKFEKQEKRDTKAGIQIDELTLADANPVWWMAPAIIAKKEKLYKKNNLEIKSFDVQTGLASKNAVVAGSAEIGLVATSPLAMGAYRKENLVILASYIQSNHLLSLITPKDASTEFPAPQEPLALVKGTISELYYVNYMNKYHPEIDISKLNEVNVKPPDVPNTMKTGSAKSAVIWEPFGTMITAKNPNLVATRRDSLYTVRLYIVTTPKVLKEKPKAVQKFVKAISDACVMLNTKPKAKAIVINTFPAQEVSLNMLWDKVEFEVKFDYSNMKTLLLQEGNLMSKLGYTPKDNKGISKKLEIKDIEYYFNHNFKLSN